MNRNKENNICRKKTNDFFLINGGKCLAKTIKTNSNVSRRQALESLLSFESLHIIIFSCTGTINVEMEMKMSNDMLLAPDPER